MEQWFRAQCAENKGGRKWNNGPGNSVQRTRVIEKWNNGSENSVQRTRLQGKGCIVQGADDKLGQTPQTHLKQ
jgi:hypothetical protein